MNTEKPRENDNKYTCAEYREEMMLAGLQRALQNTELTPEEKNKIKQQIIDLEAKMGL